MSTLTWWFPPCLLHGLDHGSTSAPSEYPPFIMADFFNKARSTYMTSQLQARQPKECISTISYCSYSSLLIIPLNTLNGQKPIKSPLPSLPLHRLSTKNPPNTTRQSPRHHVTNHIPLPHTAFALVRRERPFTPSPSPSTSSRP